MLPDRQKLPHGIPPWVREGAVFFITVSCAKRGDNQLCLAETAGGLFEAIAFRHRKREWWVRLFLLMPDHCHALISFSREVSMKASISNWKRFTSRNLNIDWQRDFFDHRVRNVDFLQEKESYIMMNPVRKGLCERPEDWSYCWRAPDFEGS